MPTLPIHLGPSPAFVHLYAASAVLTVDAEGSAAVVTSATLTIPGKGALRLRASAWEGTPREALLQCIHALDEQAALASRAVELLNDSTLFYGFRAFRFGLSQWWARVGTPPCSDSEIHALAKVTAEEMAP